MDFNGYSLFDDVEDIELRDRNRAVVLANMLEAGPVKNRNLITGYFANIPPEQRSKVFQKLIQNLNERHIEIDWGVFKK